MAVKAFAEGVTGVGKGGKHDGRPCGRPLVLPLRSPYALKLLPHPHPPVAFGFLKVKPEPCIEVT